MSRLTRDGTAEPVLREQILRRERGQEDIHFSCIADHVQDWQPYPVDPYSSRMRKILPGVNVIIAAYRHGSNERNCASWNNSRHHNSTSKRTSVTNTYIKTHEHIMLSDVASSLSRRPSRNATKQLRSLE